jgi:hypothetical protein
LSSFQVSIHGYCPLFQIQIHVGRCAADIVDLEAVLSEFGITTVQRRFGEFGTGENPIATLGCTSNGEDKFHRKIK